MPLIDDDVMYDVIMKTVCCHGLKKQGKAVGDSSTEDDTDLAMVS